MDSIINAAGRALAAGDPLGALKRVSLRDDPPALALRGIAMARLGDLDRARDLLKRAARAFGRKEPVSRARCIVADAEIALVSRDLGRAKDGLHRARETLEESGDAINAAHARHLESRRLLLSGHVDLADQMIAPIDLQDLPELMQIAHHLVIAAIAIRRLQTQKARNALEHAGGIAQARHIPVMQAEVARAQQVLETPAANLKQGMETRTLLLDDVAVLLDDNDRIVVDACRYVIRAGSGTVRLASRPVLFSLIRTLAEAWPQDAGRDVLLARAFRARHVDESHRARLRVEIGRLRRHLANIAQIVATPTGFQLIPDDRYRDIAVLSPPVEARHGTVLAMLLDGEAWSSSALAQALGTSQRTIQRALDDLAREGTVQSYGKGRAQRWITPPLPGFTTTLLLPGILPID